MMWGERPDGVPVRWLHDEGVAEVLLPIALDDLAEHAGNTVAYFSSEIDADPDSAVQGARTVLAMAVDFRPSGEVTADLFRRSGLAARLDRSDGFKAVQQVIDTIRGLGGAVILPPAAIPDEPGGAQK